MEGAATAAGYRESELIWNRAQQRDTLSARDGDGETGKMKWDKKKGGKEGQRRGRKEEELLICSSTSSTSSTHTHLRGS